MLRVLVVLMTRVPIPGLTKTRLMTHFTGEQCAELHCAFLKDQINLLTEYVGLPACIFFAPDADMRPLRALVGGRLPLIPQEGETLGERMSAAIRWGLSQGYTGVIVVGSDLPTLPAHVFRQAADQLDKSDVVLGPTLDGGYYLLGVKDDYPQLFQDISWGKGNVFAQTIGKIRQLGLRPAQLIPWNDVDTFADLTLLKEQLDTETDDDGRLHRFTRRAVTALLAGLRGGGGIP